MNRIYFYLAVFLILSHIKAICQEKVFVREFTYEANEMDSKISCRAIAIDQVRAILLNELGVYVHSESKIQTKEVDGKFKQDFVETISTISAGITKLEIIDETWDGRVFWMKASIKIDLMKFEESLKEAIADNRKTKELEEVKRQLKNSIKELAMLKRELETLQSTNTSALNELNTRYNKKIDFLTSGDLLYHAFFKIKEKDVLGAIADLTKAIELNPTFVFAYYSRGVSKAMIEDYYGAISDLSIAINSDTQWATAYYYRGLSRRYIKDFAGAEADQRKVIQLDKNFRLAYIDLGIIKLRLNNLKEAREILSKAISLEPNDGEAYYLRGLSKTDGIDNSGCNDFRKAANLGYEKAYKALERLCR